MIVTLITSGLRKTVSMSSEASWVSMFQMATPAPLASMSAYWFIGTSTRSLISLSNLVRVSRTAKMIAGSKMPKAAPSTSVCLSGRLMRTTTACRSQAEFLEDACVGLVSLERCDPLVDYLEQALAPRIRARDHDMKIFRHRAGNGHRRGAL